MCLPVLGLLGAAAGGSAAAGAASAAAAGFGGALASAGATAAAGVGAGTAAASAAGSSLLTMSQILAGATIAMQGVSTIMQYGAQRAAYQAQKEQIKNVERASSQALSGDLALLEIRKEQEADKAAQQMFQNRRDALVARGQVMAATGNVQGLSVYTLLGDVSAQEGRFNAAVQNNLAATNRQVEFSKLSAHSRHAQRLAGLSPAVAPSPIAAGLNFATSALPVASDLYYKNPRRDPLG